MASVWEQFLDTAVPAHKSLAKNFAGSNKRLQQLKNDLPDNLMPDSMDTFGNAVGNVASTLGSVVDRMVPDSYDSRPSISGNKVTMVDDTESPRFLGQALGISTMPLRSAVSTGSTALNYLDNAISRPTSTLVQAGFLGNPLYRDGITLDDFRAMWNESAEISPGEAFMWRLTAMKAATGVISMNPLAVAAASFSTTAPPIDIYDKEVRKELDESFLWNLSSGAADAAFQIIVGGKGVDDAAKATYRLSGINTKIDGARDLEKLSNTLENHILYVETNGAQGKTSVLGRHLDDIAGWDTVADIERSPAIYGPKSSQIASMLEDVTDLRTIAKVVLANLGDRRAIAALLQEDLDWATELTDLTLRIQLANAAADGPITYTTDQGEFIYRIYDRALDRPSNAFYKSVRDVFLSTERAPVGTVVRAADGSVDEVPLSGTADSFEQSAGASADIAPLVGGKANASIHNSLVRDAERAGVKLDDPRGGSRIANEISQFRARQLIDADSAIKHTTVNDGTISLDLNDDYTYRAYMKAFYPEITDDSVITLYRGLKDGEDVFKTPGTGQADFKPGWGSYWSTNPIVAKGFGASTKVVSIQVPFGDLKKYDWRAKDKPANVYLGPDRGTDAAEDSIILDYTRIPDGIKRTVTEVEINVPSGSVNTYDGLAKYIDENRISQPVPAQAIGDNGLYTGTTVNSRTGPMTGIPGRIQRRASMAANDVRLGRSPIAPESSGWQTAVLGNPSSGKPLQVMMQWAGGRKVSGSVDVSGSTPEDLVDEFLAYMGSIKFTRGERSWSFVREGEEVAVTGPQFRSDWISRFAYAQRQGTTAVVEQLTRMETEAISSVITRFGLTRAQSEELAALVVNGKNASLTNTAEVGFFFDDYASLIRVHPVTQRQLADSYTMFPIEEFAREARIRFGKQGKLATTALKARHFFDQMYEFIQKWMRTQQLIKPAYIKNSVIEPVVAMAVNLGADQVGSIALSGIKAQKNFWTNRARQLGASVIWVGDKMQFTPGSRINKKLADLHQQRLILEDKMDSAEAVLQAARVGDSFSPAHRLHAERVMDKELGVIRPQLQAIYRQLDLEDDGWVDAVPNARFSDVRAEVDTLNRLVDDPEMLLKFRTQLAGEQARISRAYNESVSLAAADRISASSARAVIRAQLDLAADPTLEGKRAGRVSIDRKRVELQIAERRLAWAERVTREGALDMNGSERAALDDRIQQLRIERADEQIRASAGEQDMLTSVTPSTSKLDKLDALIAKLQVRRDDMTVIEAPIPFAAQEVLDNNPALIARLRAELGKDADVVAPLTKLPDDGDIEFAATIDEVQRGIRERERAAAREIADLEAGLPKMAKAADSDDYMYEPTAEDIADIRATLIRAKDDTDAGGLETEWTEFGTPIDPDYPIQFLSATDEAVWRREGIIPLYAMKRMSEARSREELASWYEYGDSSLPYAVGRDNEAALNNVNSVGIAEYEGKAFAWSANSKSSKKWLTADDARKIRDGEFDVEAVLALSRKFHLTPEQADFIRKTYGVPARAKRVAGERLYVRPPWADRVSTAGQQERLDNDVANQVLELENMMYDQYTTGLQDIAEVRLRVEEDVAVLRSSGDTYKQMWDEYRQSADYAARNGKPVVAPMDDPVPGPFNASILERQLREQDAILANAERILSTPMVASKRELKLEAQIRRAETLAAASPEVIERIRLLQDMATDAAHARLAIGPFASPTDKVEMLAREIQAITDEIGGLSPKAMSAERRRERLKARAMSGEGPATTRSSQGTTIEYPGLFAKDQFGTAMRQTFSSDYSNRATLDPSLTGIASADRISMANGSVTVPPTSPMYFEELTYVSNRHVTGDRLVALFLQGRSNQAILDWLQTPAGKRYQEQMSWSNEQLKERIVGSVKDQTDPSRSVSVWSEGEVNYLRRILEQYYPTQAARDLVLKGEVTPSQLREALQEIPIEQLSPIQGRAILEAKPGFMQGTRDTVNKYLDKLWGLLATNPEDVLARFPFATRYLKRELAARVDILEQQGVKLFPDQFQALKADAVSDTLREARKTFYNIVRYSNPVYAARYLFVYPQAVFNTLYRAARLTAKRPGTAMVANNAWTGLFTDHGVDVDGNPTEDYSNVETIILNVPPALKNLGVDSQVAFPAKTLEFLSDRIGASWTVQIPAQSILMHKPEWNDLMKDMLGPSYKMVFPFGTPSGLNDVTIGPIAAGSLIPGYSKSASRAIKGLFSMSDEQHLRVTTQILEHDIGVWNYRAENTDSVTLPGAAPTVEDAANKANWYWGITALVQWGVPGGGGVKAVGQIEKDIIRNILEKNNFDREKALPEIQQAIPYMDPEPLMASTSSYSAFVPSTIAAYEMVVDPDLEGLFTTITRYGNGDPEMAEIIVADKVGEFDANVYDALGAKSIPGSDDFIRDRPPVEILQARIEAQKSWDKYNAMRANFDAAMIRQDRSTYSDAMQDQWNEGMADFISRPENKTWYAQWGQRDSTTATRALDTITLALADPAMEPHLNSAYWKAMSGYMEALPNFITAYRMTDTPDQREALKLEWAGAVASEFAVMSPEFSRMYNKHLADYDLEVRLNGLL